MHGIPQILDFTAIFSARSCPNFGPYNIFSAQNSPSPRFAISLAMLSESPKRGRKTGVACENGQKVSNILFSLFDDFWPLLHCAKKARKASQEYF